MPEPHSPRTPTPAAQGRWKRASKRRNRMRPERLPGPALPRLAPPHDPGHGRPRLPHHPAGQRAGCGQSRNGSSQLIHLNLAEIKRLITRLTDRRPTPAGHIPHRSTWRRGRQICGAAESLQTTGTQLLKTAQHPEQAPLQYLGPVSPITLVAREFSDRGGVLEGIASRTPRNQRRSRPGFEILNLTTFSPVLQRRKPAFSSTRTEAGFDSSTSADTVWTSGKVRAKSARALVASGA